METTTFINDGAVSAPGDVIRVERWPTELPLLALTILAALGVWALLFLSLIGWVYAVLIGALLFFSHVGFVAYLRGSAVRLGPDQFPELHARVTELARRAGLDSTPETYLMQAGGSLNAFATKFLRQRIMVLFSDLLEACGEDSAARDMVIGHELGHHHAGHLAWMWFLVPGSLVPFLGTALSRAREYTSDRYGAALCGDPQGALRGLAILSAGGSHGRRVNLQALARQRAQLETGWMTLGKWLAGHPPLSERIAALEPSLVSGLARSLAGPVRALGILAVLIVAPAIATGFAGWKLSEAFQEALASRQAPAADTTESWRDPADRGEEARIGTDFDLLATLAEEFRGRTGTFPASEEALYNLWKVNRPGAAEPFDPFDGLRYGYRLEDDHFILWSSGPDGRNATADDVAMDSRMRQPPDEPSVVRP